MGKGGGREGVALGGGGGGCGGRNKNQRFGTDSSPNEELRKVGEPDGFDCFDGVLDQRTKCR